MSGKTYETIADEIAADIAEGRIKAGEKLLPQREFAYRRAIAPSTAGRVYELLRRRGLVTGEVGRGTFVRPVSTRVNEALFGPSSSPVDLELNYSLLPGQAEAIARSLSGLVQPDLLELVLKPAGGPVAGPALTCLADQLGRAGWSPSPGDIHLASGGRQAIAASLSALVPPGCRLGVEAQTYPVMMAIARKLGIDTVPVAMDGEGMVPARLAETHRATPLHAVYLQPHLHNPLGVSMGPERRQAIADVLIESDLPAIEDAIYSFLGDDPPLVALAPDHVVLLESFSKRMAPGLTLGIIVAGSRFSQKVATSIRTGAWGHSGFPLAAVLQLAGDGTAARIAEEKREDARLRQTLARGILADAELVGDPRAYHIMLMLPAHWRADEFVAAAAKSGISTLGARAFAASPGISPNGVRLALASPPIEVLKAALTRLNALAASPPDIIDAG